MQTRNGNAEPVVKFFSESQKTKLSRLNHELTQCNLRLAERREVTMKGFAVWSQDQVKKGQETVPVTLAGPLCTPADAFVADCQLPDLQQGDLLAILVSGAYGLTFSSLAFLSHPAPAELLVDGEEAFLVREAGKIEDALRGQRPRGETTSCTNVYKKQPSGLRTA